MTVTIRGLAAPAAAAARASRASAVDLVDRQRAWRPGHEVEPDGVCAAPTRGQDPASIGDAADLHERRPGVGGDRRAGPRPAATKARAAAAGSAERMSASPTSAASMPVARQRDGRGSRTPDSPTTSRSSGTSGRSRTARSGSTVSVRRSRLLRPISRASVASAASSSRSSCASTSGSRPSSRAAPPAARGEPADGAPPGAGPGRRRQPEGGSWRGSTTNSLARTGIVDRRSDGREVGHRAAEPVRLAQHGDRGRTAGLVGTRACDDVVRSGDGAGRRRAPLDLGDQVQAGRGEARRRPGPVALRQRPSGRHRGHASSSPWRSSRRRVAISSTTLGRPAAGRGRSRARVRGPRRPSWSGRLRLPGVCAPRPLARCSRPRTAADRVVASAVDRRRRRSRSSAAGDDEGAPALRATTSAAGPRSCPEDRPR